MDLRKDNECFSYSEVGSVPKNVDIVHGCIYIMDQRINQMSLS